MLNCGKSLQNWQLQNCTKYDNLQNIRVFKIWCFAGLHFFKLAYFKVVNTNCKIYFFFANLVSIGPILRFLYFTIIVNWLQNIKLFEVLKSKIVKLLNAYFEFRCLILGKVYKIENYKIVWDITTNISNFQNLVYFKVTNTNCKINKILLQI